MIVKQTIGKTLSVYETKSVHINYAGSKAFDEAVEIAKKGLRDEDVDKPFDFVLHISKWSADQEGNEVIVEEQIATTARNNVTGELLAVLVSEDVEAFGATSYQFLYQGDKVEVMTEQGYVIAGFNRLAE